MYVYIYKYIYIYIHLHIIQWEAKGAPGMANKHKFSQWKSVGTTVRLGVLTCLSQWKPTFQPCVCTISICTVRFLVKHFETPLCRDDMI